jgi:hypothetical protein
VGILLWLGWHCLLRPGELADLLSNDIHLDLGGGETASYRNTGVTVIRKPKTRKVAARRQHVLIEDPALMWILRIFLGLLGPFERLWPFHQATFSKRLESILIFLECKGAFPAAGLRAGGATHFFLTFRNVQYLRLRGRWVVMKSLEHYIQECLSFLNEMKLTPGARVKIAQMSSALQPVIIDWAYRAMAHSKLPPAMPAIAIAHRETKQDTARRGRRSSMRKPSTKRGQSAPAS